MPLQSERGCTTTLGCPIGEVRLAEVLEEEQSVLRCLPCCNKKKLISNGDLYSPHNRALKCTSCKNCTTRGRVKAPTEQVIGVARRAILVADRSMEETYVQSEEVFGEEKAVKE